MKRIFLASCAAVLATFAYQPASALMSVHAGTPEAQQAVAAARLPDFAAPRHFTVITASKAPSDVETVARYFRSFGVEVTITPNRRNLDIFGTYAQMTRAAHTSLEVVSGSGERIVRSKSPVTFPPAIARLVKGTSIVPGAHARPNEARPLLTTWGPPGGYGPSDIAGIYDITSVYGSGYSGRGQNVAIVACSSIDRNDIKAYDAAFSLPNVDLHVIHVDGSTTAQDGEATLDTERVHGTAPGAGVFLYLAPNCFFSEIIDAFAKIAEDNATYNFAAVSHSYGFNEGDYAANGIGQLLLDESAAIAEIAEQGVPVFSSSGDGGSWNDLGIENGTDVNYPASDINVLAVGGTTVEETQIGTRLFENAWGGSGGGVSAVFAIPSYQHIAGVASGQFKNIPDVAMLADPYTGANEYFALGGGSFAIGGTSVGTPTMAGIWAIVEGARAKAGKPHFKNTAQALYHHPGVFYDITTGGNGFYAAQRGYDNVTGLGAPDVAKMVQTLVAI